MLISNTAQSKVINQIIQETNTRQILNWYTGSGKTHIFLSVCQKLIEQNPNITIGISAYLQTNIKNQISDQAHKYIKATKIQVIDAGDTLKKNKNLYIFNPQTVYRKNYKLKFDYFIIDEAHIACHKDTIMINKIIKTNCNEKTKIIGVTATAWKMQYIELFKNAVLYQRGLSTGYKEDGRVTDLLLHYYRYEIDVKAKDYDKDGNLTKAFQKREKAALRRMCKEKIEQLLLKTGGLGLKTMIVVPPGDNCSLAYDVKDFLGDSALILVNDSDEKDVINKFKYDPNKKFLVVVYKGRIGFDMSNLTAIINLTMTRNIMTIVQEWGRLARKSKDLIKNYYYVFDKTINIEKINTLLELSVKFANCNYKDYTPNLLNMKLPVRKLNKNNNEIEITLSELFENPRLKVHKLISFNDLTESISSQEIYNRIIKWAKDNGAKQ